jgi:hypothetical protein
LTTAGGLLAQHTENVGDQLLGLGAVGLGLSRGGDCFYRSKNKAVADQMKPTRSRHSSASSCADIAVEPTKSQNITVTCRRSPMVLAAPNFPGAGPSEKNDARLDLTC